jgi:hypothetical protein
MSSIKEKNGNFLEHEKKTKEMSRKKYFLRKTPTKFLLIIFNNDFKKS